MTSIERQVGANSDDAYVQVNDMGYQDTTVCAFKDSTTANTSLVVGMRFTNITIPPGSIIQAANLLYKIDIISFDDVRVQLYCEDADDAATFSSGDSPAARTLTTASSAVYTEDNISGSGWMEILESFHTALQEVIDRPGWASGNAIVLLGIPPETSSPDRLLSIVPHNKTPADAPKIQVTFIEPPLAYRHRRVAHGCIRQNPPPEVIGW